MSGDRIRQWLEQKTTAFTKWYYSDETWASRRLKSSVTRLFRRLFWLTEKILNPRLLGNCRGWIANHKSSKVWEEMTSLFPNFNGCTVAVWEWKSQFIPHTVMGVITYPCWDYSNQFVQKSVHPKQYAHGSHIGVLLWSGIVPFHHLL